MRSPIENETEGKKKMPEALPKDIKASPANCLSFIPYIFSLSIINSFLSPSSIVIFTFLIVSAIADYLDYMVVEGVTLSIRAKEKCVLTIAKILLYC